MMITRRRSASVAVLAAALAALAGVASADTSVTAHTHLSHRADSGNHGDWAYDTADRTVNLVRGSNTGTPTAPAWHYHATLTDTGTFRTITGAGSPRLGNAIKSVTDGTFHGGGVFDFVSSSDDASAARVPTLVSGDVDPTSAWFTLFFPKGTVFTGATFTNWSWTYTAVNPCPAGHPASETWTDAYYSNGSLPSDGDIGGFPPADPCQLPPAPAPASTPGQPAPAPRPVLQVPGGVHEVAVVPVGAADTGFGPVADPNRVDGWWLAGELITMALLGGAAVVIGLRHARR